MNSQGNLNILKDFEKNKILGMLNEQFGVENIPGILLQRGAERIFLYTGDLNLNGIMELEETLPVERVGVYFGKFIDDKFRLSLEGTQMVQNQIKKGVFELDDGQVESWMSGSELNVETGFKGILAMKYKKDFLGCGKASALKIGNFIPKNRRLKLKS